MSPVLKERRGKRVAKPRVCDAVRLYEKAPGNPRVSCKPDFSVLPEIAFLRIATVHDYERVSRQAR